MDVVIIVLVVLLIVWGWSKNSTTKTRSPALTAPTSSRAPAVASTPARASASPAPSGFHGGHRDPVAAAVSAAIDARREIRFGYLDLKGKRTTRTVLPERMFRADGFYIEGFCRLRRATRTFKVERMADVEILRQA